MKRWDTSDERSLIEIKLTCGKPVDNLWIKQLSCGKPVNKEKKEKYVDVTFLTLKFRKIIFIDQGS